MNQGKYIFAQLTDFLPRRVFDGIVSKYNGNRCVKASIPTFLQISNAKTHFVKILDQISNETGSFYVMDMAYIDFNRLFKLNQ
jgi:hypothetical protein